MQDAAQPRSEVRRPDSEAKAAAAAQGAPFAGLAAAGLVKDDAGKAK